MVGKQVDVLEMSQSAWRSANRAAGDGGMGQNILPHRGVHVHGFRRQLYSQVHDGV
jgi:hypothetical protein